MILNGIQEKMLTSKTNNVDLIGFMTSMEQYDNLGKLIESQVSIREEFYKLIDGENPNLKTISDYSRNIQELQKKISILWGGLTTKNFNDYPPLVKIYAYFKVFVELQSETGKELIRKYNYLLLKRSYNENVFNSSSIYSTKSIFIVIGAES